ncbi:putative 2OG-Fe(II) oxygenase superfamily protein [Lyophyllum shimeji]|uniref:2OG-Fe(II) oxygenase superfamily protein n=1 Tax=Lyophyllum shimeji TaxID=47721 RepID=A0A9P3Q274_LYOSH|nr:putative 2OG-Fe(II) oxygenase superfamily protein [Lyophyllum shimeji]
MANPEIVEALRTAITQKIPFCTGIVPIEPGRTTQLFYKDRERPGWLDLSRASEKDLNALASACEPATFSRNNQDVLDESYRKARQMDPENFATKLDVDKLGIVDRVREQLLEGPDQEKAVNAELYKLNVYGKDAFSKSHKDTPRGENMFGSLVVVFPTPHDGGALVLRHFDQEWTFDSAAIFRQQAEPSIAYIAFYSDIDHEVAVVKSGYRVTLTYNLYLDPRKEVFLRSPLPVKPVGPDEERLRAAFASALSDPSFLPDGGYLGFGLHFKYPISRAATKPPETVLKGSDAVLYHACRKLSLKASLNAVYDADGVQVLVQPSERLDSDVQYEDAIAQVLLDECGGRVIQEYGSEKIPVDEYGNKYNEVIKLVWVTPLTGYCTFSSSYIAYWNEPTSATVYGDLCIAVEVGPFGKRKTI